MSRSDEFDGSRLESINNSFYTRSSVSPEQLLQMNTEQYVPLGELEEHLNQEYDDYQNGYIGEHKIHPQHIQHGGPSAYIDSLAADIKKNGLQEPIELFHQGSGPITEASIMDGHHRALAAIKIGMKQIPVDIQKR